MGNYISIDHPGSFAIISFYYDIFDNVMLDEDGNIIHDIYRYISPNMLLIFKEKKDNLYLPSGEEGIIYEFIYPIFDSEDYHWEEK